jgi:extracellular factor (EF) 3-hydroxypalmitic acid methyl ester biosynthesis protein
MIKRRLSALIDNAAPGSKVRILSIAAGPAQEIFELLQERTHMPCAVEVVLFDQDRRALSYSYNRLKRLVDSKWQSQVTLLHLHDSIKRLLRGATVFSGQGVFDAIYSCGLFDYLQLPTAVSLCTTLYSLLAPRGTLYIGNMVPGCQSRWIMELHLDWFLVYRERSEMLELARVAAPSAHIEIVEEETGVDPFVALTRE